MKVLASSLVMLLCTQSLTFAQRIKPLTIGSTVPDLEIRDIVNYKRTIAKLSDFKGKLVIVDFWATWCGPCIAAFPKLDSLQNRFAGKLEILPVSAESELVVSNFLKKMSAIKKVSPPSVTNDQSLSRMFPHTYLPHYVWINANSEVVAITDGNQVTDKNIEAMLVSGTAKLPVKNDEQMMIMDGPINDYILFAPSILAKNEHSINLQNVPAEDVRFQTVLTRYIKGLVSGVRHLDSTQVFITNMTIRTLFNTAFSGNSVNGLNLHSTVIELPDSTLYYKVTTYRRSSAAEYQNWLHDNGYSFALKVPAALAAKRYAIMLDYLNNYFGNLYGVEGRIEKRNAKCLALVQTDKNLMLVTKGGKPSLEVDKISLKMVNASLNALISNLVVPLQKHPPIVDETGFTGKADLELNCSLSDLKALNSELIKYGLQLVEKEKIMDIGVIGMKQQ